MENLKNFNIGFNEWLKSKLILPTVPIAIFSLMIGLLNFLQFNYSDLDIRVEDWTKIIAILNFAVAIYVLFTSSNRFRISKKDKKTSESEKKYYKYLSLKKGVLFSETNSLNDWLAYKIDVNRTIEQFTLFWILIWVSYLTIYGCQIFRGVNEDLLTVFATFFNNLGSLMFIFMFMTLSVSTSKMGWFSWLKYIGLVFLISIIEGTLFLSGIDDYKIYFGVFSGLFGGVAIAAFVSSIDSKFINFPIWVVLSLYFYAAIQSFYLILYYHKELGVTNIDMINTFQPILLGIALLMKIIMFWAVTWILRTNRLLFAIFEEGSLNYQREINFNNFNSIVRTEEQRFV